MLKQESVKGKCVIVVSHNKEIEKYSDVSLKLKDDDLYETKK